MDYEMEDNPVQRVEDGDKRDDEEEGGEVGEERKELWGEEL